MTLIYNRLRRKSEIGRSLPFIYFELKEIFGKKKLEEISLCFQLVLFIMSRHTIKKHVSRLYFFVMFEQIVL